MKSKKPAPSYSVTPTIQRLILSIAVAAYVVSIGVPVYYTLSQSQGLSTLSGFAPWLVSAGLIPLVLFLITLRLNPKRDKLQRLNLLFETIIIATAGLSIVTALNQLSIINTSWLLGTNSSLLSYNAYQYCVQLLGVILFTCLLVWLRRTKQWLK